MKWACTGWSYLTYLPTYYLPTRPVPVPRVCPQKSVTKQLPAERMFPVHHSSPHTRESSAAATEMSREQRCSEVSPAELLRLAGELQTLALTFPQQPSDEVEAAACILKVALQSVAACISPCRLLRLPEELLLRMLRTLNSRDFAALACSCHALSDGSLCILIERGAQDALHHQYSAELAVLPPTALRAPARLRWLERARIEAQRWLESAHHDRTLNDQVGARTIRAMWPKPERVDEPPSVLALFKPYP